MIEVSGLGKNYGKTRALTDVSLSLSPGVTGLLGPNGAGKTTLLRCLLGIIRPTSGAVTFSEMREPTRLIGYLPQRFGLLRELTVREAMSYFATLKRMRPELIEPGIDSCLRQVNLEDQTEVRVRSLSGGMIRRVGIAAALLGEPEALIFDEPTAGLDPEERVRFRRLVSGLADTRTILISTHIVEDVVAVAGNVIVLHHGRVRASGTPQDISNSALGKCYVAPRELVDENSRDYYVDGYKEIGAGSYARVLSVRPHEGFTPVYPSVEDGYLCITRDML